MNAQTITVLSGIILLIVFALVGWNVQRRRHDERGNEKGASREPR